MIYYLGFFNTSAAETAQRKGMPAAISKMDFVARAMLQSGADCVQIVSPAGADKPCRCGVYNVGENLELKFFSTLGGKNKLLRGISYFMIKAALLCYLLFHINGADTVAVYHSLYYMRIVALAKKIKKFNLLLEIEEIYSDVTGNSSVKGRETEFFKCADSYLFPTRQLNELINNENKPFVISHGTYITVPDYNEKFDDNKIHIVYAGTLDPRKGGAMVAAQAGAFLGSEYHIHIIGFGSDAEKRKLDEEISLVKSKGGCEITFDGLKSGQDYCRFIQKCSVGLSTQNPDAAFNATSFPSKILSYMANGLRVVSIRIPVVETSEIGDMVVYYDEQSPRHIAQAICSINFDDGYDSRSRINDLMKSFVAELKNMLN